jgi:pyridinium-3,5-biscarboxylic acid mononucleotide sulfurtransferase
MLARWHFGRVVSEKFDRLRAMLRSYGSCLVAYSGGVDSAFLAVVAHQVLGQRSLAVIADSPSLPRRELEEARELAEQFRFPLRVIETEEFSNPEYLANPTNRCFFCKHELFARLMPIATQERFAVIAYGENASDVGDFRPGAEAAAKFRIRAPLKEVGLTKADIRDLSAELGLPTAEKAQMACLSSRIPYGEPVSPEKLGMIEAAENILRDLGLHDVRVRHHDLKPGALARIEIGLNELPEFRRTHDFEAIAEKFRAIGYVHTTLDLRGYRRGSLNEAIGKTHPS